MKRTFAASKTLLVFALATCLGTPGRADSRNPESGAATTTVHVGTSSLTPRLLVRIAKPEGRKAHLRLEDAYGQAVFATQTRKTGRTWNRALQLQELPRGTYHLVVSDHRYRPVYQQRVELTTTRVPDPELRVLIP